MSKSNSLKRRQQKLAQIRNLINENNFKRAMYEIVNYVATYPDDMLGHYLYGKILLRKNSLQPARREFYLVAEHQDENEVKALMNIATIAVLEGDPEEAIRIYKKVIEDSEYTDIYAINVLAHLLRHEKRYEEALDILSKNDSCEPELEKERVKNLSLLGRVEEALEVLELLTPETRNEEREMSLNKGRIAKAKDEYDCAKFYYEDAKEGLDKDEIYYKTVYEEAKLALAYEHYEEALYYCDELTKAGKTFGGEVFLFSGQAHQALSDFKAAYVNYLKAAQLAEDRDVRATAYYSVGSIDFARGSLSLAETSFKRSIANAREASQMTYTKLIGVLLRQEKYDEVMKFLNRLNRTHPEMVVDGPLDYVRMLVDKRTGKHLPPRDQCSYAERQIIKYQEQEAIAHIKSHHCGTTKTRGNFSPNIDIDTLYYDIRSSLIDDNLVNEEAMDIYEIDYHNAGYDLENNLVHRVRVVVFPHTRNILTMYPGNRATIPRKGDFKKAQARQKAKVKESKQNSNKSSE